MADVATNETSNLISADKVTGTTVYNRQGEKLGSVYDVMLNKRSGQVAYAIMSFGGFLGMGDKYFAIPWNAFHFDLAQKRAVLHLEKTRLENAPGFDKDMWPNLADQQWGAIIYKHYGYTPYWDELLPPTR